MLTILRAKNGRGTHNNETGFTLVELIIVVVILGILAAIAIPFMLNQTIAAIAGTVKSDVSNNNLLVATALVKTPEARFVAGTWDKPFQVTVVTLKEAHVGDDENSTNTFMPVVSHEDTQIEIWGTWDNYRVIGTNLKNMGGAYTYYSAEAKYEGTADLR